MSGILAATILMLHLLLLTSIFVNFGKYSLPLYPPPLTIKSTHPPTHPLPPLDTMDLKWLGQIRYLSFFQYGYEALVSNEMAGTSDPPTHPSTHPPTHPPTHPLTFSFFQYGYRRSPRPQCNGR